MQFACIFFFALLTSCMQLISAAQLRVERQAGRFGAPPGYRPTFANYNPNVRSGNSPGVKAVPSQQIIGRPQGVGGFSFGGMASGRPTYGMDFVVNAGNSKPQRYAGARPQSNVLYRAGQSGGQSAGGGGRPLAAYQYS